MIKAIFFDFDGVIVDSEKLHTDNTINYFKEANIPLSDSIVYGDIGSNPKLNYWKGVYDEYKDIIPYTYEEFDEGILNAHKKLKNFNYGTIMFPEVKEALTTLKEKGFFLALASSSAMEYLQRNIKACGLEGIFDFVISGRDLTESKPSPQIYNKCKEHFGLSDDECIVVEDSALGIQAAKNANLYTIGIKDYRFGINQEKADILVDNLKDVTNLILKSHNF